MKLQKIKNSVVAVAVKEDDAGVCEVKIKISGKDSVTVYLKSPIEDYEIKSDAGGKLYIRNKKNDWIEFL